MHLKYHPIKIRKIFIFLLLIFLEVFGLGSSYSKELPLLATKQLVSKIVFISEAGDFSYYIKGTNTLMFASKYSVKEVISGPSDSHFTIVSSGDLKKLIIDLDPFYLYGSEIRSHFLYSIDYGGTVLKPIGKGMYPKLHLNDTFISYYLPSERTIKFQSLVYDQNYNRFTIKLHNPISPYFIPEVVMYNENNILYTDRNSDGKEAIFLLQRNKGSVNVMMKSPKQFQRVELCLSEGEDLIIGLFSMLEKGGESEIYSLNLKKSKDFSQIKKLYSSGQSDLGKIICTIKGPNLYFIKNMSSSNSLTFVKSELASINKKTKEIAIISELGSVTQILNISNRILIPIQGQIYVALGNNELANDSLVDEKMIQKRGKGKVDESDLSDEALRLSTIDKMISMDTNKEPIQIPKVVPSPTPVATATPKQKSSEKEKLLNTMLSK